MTTANVVEIPTPRAPPEALKPSWQPKIPIIAPKVAALNMPPIMSAKLNENRTPFKNVSYEISTKKTETSRAPAMATKFAKITRIGSMMTQARKRGITKVVFDRSGARYHGKVKALADAARAGVLFSPGTLFMPDARPSRAMRLTVACADEDEIRRGVAALGEVANASRAVEPGAGRIAGMHL